MKLLILIGLVLLIIAVHQLMRVVELSRQFKKGNEWSVKDSDNSFNGKAMLLFGFAFIAFFFWQANRWNDNLLPAASSLHGVKVDTLWDYNMYIIVTVFVLTNAVLFYFAYKYRGTKETKATFLAHDNRLEMIWTIVPAVVLAFIIIFGLKYWNEITDRSNDPNKITIELYAKQFDWTARYAGFDKTLGSTDYRQIDGGNVVGMDTLDPAGNDDIIVKNEFHIPVNKEIEFKMRSRDVIHSAYMPHFRAQMNCVPGMVTEFKFTPSKTTAEMRKDPYVIQLMKGINEVREKRGEEPVEFDYILLCNKICGASHYNMQMTIIVESEKDYKDWLLTQPRFKKRVVSK
ncbi:MAG: cytochrome oxidase subunit [Bacteroidota bacterium]|jgi:cytochrome c oxidase subunit 2|nr:cytochrome oxidase subunit [Bacteroidota bacterium]